MDLTRAQERSIVPAMVTLHYHPFSRAAGVVWMLEEVGVDYELRFVDLFAGAHKKTDFLKMNPMGKLPTLEDGGTVVTESAAIGLYLADRYAAGTLAPPLEDAQRGAYYRWSLFAPSVIEPGAAAKAYEWEGKESSVGWGNYDAMLMSIESAVAGREFLLGQNFTMADAIFGGTIRFMLQFEMIEARPAFTSYVKRLEERPALQRADEKNAAAIAKHGHDKK